MTQYTEKDMTPFFDSNKKPARVGAYQTDAIPGGRGAVFQYWNGQYWGCWTSSPAGAFHDRESKSLWQKPMWRGLSFDPSEAPK